VGTRRIQSDFLTDWISVSVGAEKLSGKLQIVNSNQITRSAITRDSPFEINLSIPTAPATAEQQVI